MPRTRGRFELRVLKFPGNTFPECRNHQLKVVPHVRVIHAPRMVREGYGTTVVAHMIINDPYYNSTGKDIVNERLQINVRMTAVNGSATKAQENRTNSTQPAIYVYSTFEEQMHQNNVQRTQPHQYTTPNSTISMCVFSCELILSILHVSLHSNEVTLEYNRKIQRREFDPASPC